MAAQLPVTYFGVRPYTVGRNLKEIAIQGTCSEFFAKITIFLNIFEWGKIKGEQDTFSKIFFFKSNIRICPDKSETFVFMYTLISIFKSFA